MLLNMGKVLRTHLYILLLVFLWQINTIASPLETPLNQEGAVIGAATTDQPAEAFNFRKYILKQNIQFGIDHWGGNFANPLTTGFLNTPTTGTYSDIIPWFKISASYLPLGNNDVRFNLDYRYDKTLGGNLDQASLDFAVSSSVGARIGVLPMRLNFCRTYEQDNPWIMEISTSCKYASQSIYRSTNSAPGAQLYLNTGSDDWMSSYQVGFFQPALLGYDKSEFGYQVLPATTAAPRFVGLKSTSVPEPDITETDSNNKFVLNYEGLSPSSGIEFKTGILWALATASQPNPSTGYLNSYPSYRYEYGSTIPNAVSTNEYQTLFSGISIPLTNSLLITPTYNLLLGNLSGPTGTKAGYYQFSPPNQKLAGNIALNPGNNTKRVQNLGVELKYGFSNNSFLTGYYGVSSLSTTTSSYLYNIDKKVVTLAYRQDLESGFFYIVQGVYGWQTTVIRNVPTPAAGGYLGLRLGYLLH